MDESGRRLRLAEEMVCEYRQEMGDHLVAAACYGSLAHEKADAHSDLEFIALTDNSIDPVNIHTISHGIQVECHVLPTERLLRAAQIVTPEWGIEADSYRCHRLIWDPSHQFAAVRAASLAIYSHSPRTIRRSPKAKLVVRARILSKGSRHGRPRQSSGSSICSLAVSLFGGDACRTRAKRTIPELTYLMARCRIPGILHR